LLDKKLTELSPEELAMLEARLAAIDDGEAGVEQAPLN
jgi:hypothetical protein